MDTLSKHSLFVSIWIATHLAIMAYHCHGSQTLHEPRNNAVRARQRLLESIRSTVFPMNRKKFDLTRVVLSPSSFSLSLPVDKKWDEFIKI